MADQNPLTEYDLMVPEKEKPVLTLIQNQLKLTGRPPREIIKRVESFFQKEFRYSLVLTGMGNKKTPLSDFLMQTRSGHCEYFAAATVLLLRVAGIPARYAKGYSVHEFSRLENQYIVRDRHAHAWTLAFIEGAWRNVDTTPASWANIEAAAAPGWEFISDLLSWCRFNLSKALWRVRQSRWLKHIWWFVVPLIFIMARRLHLKRRVRHFRPEKPTQTDTATTMSGTASEFYLIEQALINSGFVRHRTETLRDWIARLPESRLTTHLIGDLKTILNLHYRYRFDPKGIDVTERELLKSGIRTWLNEYSKESGSRGPGFQNQRPPAKLEA
jgi:hypothetical protein